MRIRRCEQGECIDIDNNDANESPEFGTRRPIAACVQAHQSKQSTTLEDAEAMLTVPEDRVCGRSCREGTYRQTILHTKHTQRERTAIAETKNGLPHHTLFILPSSPRPKIRFSQDHFHLLWSGFRLEAPLRLGTLRWQKREPPLRFRKRWTRRWTCRWGKLRLAGERVGRSRRVSCSP